MTSITIPNSVVEVGYSAFYDCSNLANVSIGKGVTSIGYEAFYGCNSLTSVNITDVAAWCKIVFHTSYGNPLYYANKLYLNGELVEDLVIPDGVISLSHGVFKNCSSLKSVVIPDSVTSIGYEAFYGCNKLESVVIPDSVTSISDSAFRSCSSLTSVVIPDSVTSIGDSAFRSCSSLTSVVIGDSVTSIGSSAFSFCSSLTSVEIPDSVTSIGSSAFSFCSSLTSVVIPNSVTSIGDYAFEDCRSLISIELPDNVTSIGEHVFYKCSSLKSVTIPNSVTSIGYEAFYGCNKLESVVIPDSVTSIGGSAFSWCGNLTSVYYAGTWAQWDEVMIAQGNDSLASATIRTKEDNPVLIGISMKQNPVKAEYVLGEALDTSGLVLTGSYSNSSTADITEGYTVSGFDSATVGTKTITVTYEGYTTTFTVVVKEPMACEHLETATQYKTLEEALAAATSGTVKLLTDATVDTIILKPGVTLDLNGYTLTTEYVFVLDSATILDGGIACTGGGLLKVAEKNLGFIRENGQGVIPVWNGVDGYVFTKVTFQQMARTAGEGAAQYIFLPTFSNPEAAALMADGCTDNGLKIQVCLTWNNGNTRQFYTYSDDLVAKVFDGTGKWVFDLKVTGIGAIADMVASPVVITDSHAQATTTGTALVAG